MKSLPKEPTEEMLDAGAAAFGGHKEGRPVWKLTMDRQAYYVYQAMLTKAPKEYMMNKQSTFREAAQQALAYIRWYAFGSCRTEGHTGPIMSAVEITEMLESALALPDEPVAEPTDEQITSAWESIPDGVNTPGWIYSFARAVLALRASMDKN